MTDCVSVSKGNKHFDKTGTRRETISVLLLQQCTDICYQDTTVYTSRRKRSFSVTRCYQNVGMKDTHYKTVPLSAYVPH